MIGRVLAPRTDRARRALGRLREGLCVCPDCLAAQPSRVALKDKGREAARAALAKRIEG